MLYTLQNKRLTVTVSDQGAELKSIRGADGIRYLYEGDTPYWTDSSPVLFPFVARLNHGEYVLDGHVYQMDIHGFAKDSSFSVKKVSERSVTLSLQDSSETMKCFPRRFLFDVKYSLKGSLLEVTFSVKNKDSRILYFGLGAHPGFNVPLEDGLSFEDYYLEAEPNVSPVRVGFSEDFFLNGIDTPYPFTDGKLSLSHRLFDHDAVVLTNAGHSITLKTENGPHKVTVSFPDMNIVGLWHMPDTDAPYLCIEPWCSLPAVKDQLTVFEEYPSLLRLEPGETLEKRFTMEFL